MKKRLSLLVLLTTLVACGKEQPSNTLSIVCPTGAPAVAFYNKNENYNLETNGVPSNIVAMMNSENGKDIVVIDTVSGVKAINNGANYKIAATITFGNFYIASTGHDQNNEMDESDKIVLFGQNQTPDLIFHYLYGNKYDANIEYVTNAQDAAKCLVSSKNAITKSDIDYVFIAQPALYAALNNENAATYGKASSFINIQEEYKKKSEIEMIQASVFVKNSLDKKNVDAFLETIEKDILKGIEEPNLIKEGMAKWDDPQTFFGVNGNIASTVTKNNNGLGLGFKKAIDIKENIDSFLSLFSLGGTNEEIYYK